MLPEKLCAALGRAPGTTVDISPYGSGIQITPGGRMAQLERGHPVASSLMGDTSVTDETMYALIGSGRR